MKKNVPYIWTNEQQKAFELLKQKLTEVPILTHPDFNQQFIVFTDASAIGLGAILSQKDDEGHE
jgi:phosphatidate phosphatase APP1